MRKGTPPPAKAVFEQGGFSLLEMMVTVVIIAILTATATMGYTHYLERANRSMAKSTLVDVSQRLERYYTDNNSYDGFTLPSGLSRVPESPSAPAMYAIAVTTDDQSFSVTATPQNRQVNDDCGTLSVDNVGRKAATGAGVCW